MSRRVQRAAIAAAAAIAAGVAVAASAGGQLFGGADELRVVDQATFDRQHPQQEPTRVAGGKPNVPVVQSPPGAPVGAIPPPDARIGDDINPRDVPRGPWLVPIPDAGTRVTGAQLNRDTSAPSGAGATGDISFSVRFLGRYTRDGQDYVVQVLQPSRGATRQEMLVGRERAPGIDDAYVGPASTITLIRRGRFVTINGGDSDAARLAFAESLTF